MDKPGVYIETSIVSYLAARPSRDPVTLRNQQVTHEWWATAHERYALFTSFAVRTEASVGDPALASRRIELLRPLTLLFPRGDVDALAKHLEARVPLPPNARTDAVHIALAAVYGLAYVLTWNCRHIANPRLWPRMEAICTASGLALPVLCTPRDLQGG
jgi:predicted nucleic acid-binding protein